MGFMFTKLADWSARSSSLASGLDTKHVRFKNARSIWSSGWSLVRLNTQLFINFQLEMSKRLSLCCDRRCRRIIRFCLDLDYEVRYSSTKKQLAPESLTILIEMLVFLVYTTTKFRDQSHKLVVSCHLNSTVHSLQSHANTGSFIVTQLVSIGCLV